MIQGTHRCKSSINDQTFSNSFRNVKLKLKFVGTNRQLTELQICNLRNTIASLNSVS